VFVGYTSKYYSLNTMVWKALKKNTEHRRKHNFNFKYGYGKIRVGNRNTFGVLVGKPKCKRPIWRTRHRWEDAINMELKETGLEGMARINLAQDRASGGVVMKMVNNLQVLQNAENFLPGWESISFSRGTVLHGDNYIKETPSIIINVKWCHN